MRLRTADGWIREGFCILVRLYQVTLSNQFGPCCRFIPSCSSYALLSIRRFGIRQGLRLICKRVVRCHPLHPGGYDPVPEILSCDFLKSKPKEMIRPKHLWKKEQSSRSY